MSEASPTREGQALAQQSIHLHSKSFSLASRLLPPGARHDAVVLYAYCRRADDAIDLVAPEVQPAALAELRRELDAIYAGEAQADPILREFSRLVGERGLPRVYPEELIEGMAMDVRGTFYADPQVLLQYCYRVASVVGLMMCHVMGVREDRALPHAAHLGIGMQLTNICRDVLEDWERGRLYLPATLLAKHGVPDLHDALGGPLPEAARPAIAAVTAELLELADRYYASGDAGLEYLQPRCAFAVRAARSIYADIGREVRGQGCDPLAGRAHVSKLRKLWLALRSGVRTLISGGARTAVAPSRVLPFSHAQLEGRA